MLRSTPAVVNGKVYIGSDDGNVYCLNADTGQLLWNYYAGFQFVYSRVKPPLRSSPMVVDGKLYVGTLGNATICLNAETGALIWKYSMPGYVTSSPCVTNGAVYSICYYAAPDAPANTQGNASLYKLDAADGSLIRTYNVPLGVGIAGSAVIGRGEIWASPTVADGMIFMPAQAWKIYGINETTGDIQWIYTIPDSVFATASMTYVAETGKVYFTSRFNMVCADAFNGTVLWSTYLGREIYSSPAYADGKIYLQTDSRLVYCLDANSGAKLSWCELDSEAWASPAVWNGKLYVGCLDNNVYCFGDFPIYAKTQTTAISLQESDQPTALSGSVSPSVTRQNTSAALPLSAVYALATFIIIVIPATIVLRKRKKEVK
jgi:outer membrane protein assembly factor BamB